jgi:hydroxymethylbilane synthase
MIEISAERSFLKTLDGNCRTPIAAYAHISGDILHLTGQLLSEDGTKYSHARDTSSLDKAEHLGNRLGHLVKIKFQSQL